MTMTRSWVSEALMWLIVIGGIAYGWAEGWNPIATGIGLLVIVAATYYWSHRPGER